MNDATETSPPQTLSQRQSPRRRWLLVIPLILVLALLAARNYFGENLPRLTDSSLQIAQSRWQAAAPRNYALTVEVLKPALERYVIEVRNGEVQSVTLNDNAITERRVMDTWSVPGMFATQLDDLAAVASHANGTATKTTPRLHLWCEFDSQLGWPKHYRRLDWEHAHDITWKVTRFEIQE